MMTLFHGGNISMTSSLLAQVDRECFKSIRLIATDMDGTLTTQGKFTSQLVQTLEQLAQAGFSVLIVTGRSAGWVSGLVHYLPVVGAIAENGGIFFPGNSAAKCWLIPMTDLATHRLQLAQVFEDLKKEFPYLQASTDNQYRLSDWTFDVAELTIPKIERLSQRCVEQGWSITYSTVQVHIKLSQQNKAAGLLTVLAKYFRALTPNQILTVGDSPNDESLFDPQKFPLSVGVANVQEYLNHLTHHPTYITTAFEGAGFCELAQKLVTLPQ